MKEFNTLDEIEVYIKNEGNYHYRDSYFGEYMEFETAARNFFDEITADYENREEYYKEFGLKPGECFIRRTKEEKYYVHEINNVVVVKYYEAYVDSGVPASDYYYGWTYNY